MKTTLWVCKASVRTDRYWRDGSTIAIFPSSSVSRWLIAYFMQRREVRGGVLAIHLATPKTLKIRLENNSMTATKNP